LKVPSMVLHIDIRQSLVGIDGVIDRPACFRYGLKGEGSETFGKEVKVLRTSFYDRLRRVDLENGASLDVIEAICHTVHDSLHTGVTAAASIGRIRPDKFERAVEFLVELTKRCWVCDSKLSEERGD
jgi:hypothetical protein